MHKHFFLKLSTAFAQKNKVDDSLSQFSSSATSQLHGNKTVPLSGINICKMSNKTKVTLEAQILHANAVFTTNLYQILARNQGNIFFSPISIHAALSMLYQGAQEKTAHALSHTLKTPDAKSTAEGYKTAIKHLNSMQEIKLLIANKIYGNKDKTKFLKEFEETIVTNFESEIDFLDITNPKGAAETVNKWVEKKTENKIRNIVNEQLFKNGLSLILINAIYFKGEWNSKFKEAATKTDKFHLDDKSSVEVKMMYQKGSYLYEQNDEFEAQIIELPYKGFYVKMMIVLPNDNIEKLEAKLAKTDLSKLGQNLEHSDVHLYLPKFKMEETIQLTKVLSEMGLKPIFDVNQANFKGMIDSSSLQDNVYVSEVIQKAFIEVNEGGTVAAAATRAAMVLGCAPGARKPEVTFKVDRPAIFLLIAPHGEANDINVLFFGRLSQPEY